MVLLDSDLYPCLAVLLVAALYKVGYAIRVPQKASVVKLTEQEFDNFLTSEGSKIYYNYVNLMQGCCFYINLEELVN